MSDPEDIDFCISRTEQLSSKHRRIHKDLANSKDDYEINYGKEILEVTASATSKQQIKEKF